MIKYTATPLCADNDKSFKIVIHLSPESSPERDLEEKLLSPIWALITKPVIETNGLVQQYCFLNVGLKLTISILLMLNDINNTL